MSQSSDFDFDEVDESFCQKLRDNTSQNRTENTPNLAREESETQKQGSSNDTGENNMHIIDLTSDPEGDSAEDTSKDVDLQSASKTEEEPRIKLEPGSVESQEPTKPDKTAKKPVKPDTDLNSDSAPPLISAEDISKLAAQNPTVADEPPILTKMNPTHRASNSLEDMISRLKTRVLTTQPSSSDSSLNGADCPAPMDLEQDKSSTDKSPASVEHPLGMMVEPISDPSSPDTENIESYPPSPSSLRSDVSKPESLDRKSEISTGSSRRSTKPPAKKLKSKLRDSGKCSMQLSCEYWKNVFRPIFKEKVKCNVAVFN